MQKSLDRKLQAIHADPHGSQEFIIADAKDADMAFGIGAPGLSPERHDGELQFKTLQEYREQIRQVIRQGVVDIVLMSASTSEQLAIRERLFEDSHVTPAARANDATDVHVVRGGRVHEHPAQPFRTATIDHIQCGRVECDPQELIAGANLGLYSVTFNNDCKLDLHTLEQFKRFREEAERKGFRYFLEVFNPNTPGAVEPKKLPQFINDVIARTLAGVPRAGRPVFLKIAWQGPRAMEELVRYDPHLIVGVLGGSAGTTLDAFQLIHDAKKYGARAALFGRKINQAENQLAFIEFLRHIADGVIEPTEAVRAYHAVLEKLGLQPHRPLEHDLTLQTSSAGYAGGSSNAAGSGRRKTISISRLSKSPESSSNGMANTDAAPDFTSMSSADRVAHHLARLDQKFGR